MIGSAREQILQAMAETLVDIEGLVGGVWRSRRDVIARGECPLIIIEPVSDSAQQNDYTFLTWTLQVQIIVVTRGQEPDRLADPIITAIHERLMDDQTLGGRAMDLQPVSVAFSAESADQVVGYANYQFSVTYQTPLQSMAAR